MSDVLNELEKLSLDKPTKRTAKILGNLEYRRLQLILLREILLELRELKVTYRANRQ